MSKFILTRTADQCRSHHQKLSLYHQTVENIIKEYEPVRTGATGTDQVQEAYL